MSDSSVSRLSATEEVQVGWAIWLWYEGVLMCSGGWLDGSTESVIKAECSIFATQGGHQCEASGQSCSVGLWILPKLDSWGIDYVSRSRIVGKVEYWGDAGSQGVNGEVIALNLRLTDLWTGEDEDLNRQLSERFSDVKVWPGHPSDQLVRTTAPKVVIETSCSFCDCSDFVIPDEVSCRRKRVPYSPTGRYVVCSECGEWWIRSGLGIDFPVRSYPMPDLETSDSPVSGWRTWEWRDGLLHGYREPWPEAAKVAVCHSDHDAPTWNCKCGVYADRGPKPRVLCATGQVRGRVEMWGDLIEHENGYRASHARMTDLWAGDDEDLFLELTMRYPDVTVWMGEPDEREEGNG